MDSALDAKSTSSPSYCPSIRSSRTYSKLAADRGCDSSAGMPVDAAAGALNSKPDFRESSGIGCPRWYDVDVNGGRSNAGVTVPTDGHSCSVPLLPRCGNDREPEPPAA